MRALILSTQSFIDGGTKVGSQYLAHALAANGWQVDYVPTLSSPLDLIGRQRHARLGRAWRWRHASRLAPGLVEWSVRAPFPAHRWFLRYGWQLTAYGKWLPQRLRETSYDLCLTDVAPNLLLLPHVRARVNICRLNDWPWGFATDLHPIVPRQIEATLGSGRFSEVWAVSQPLLGYAQSLHSPAQVVLMPNGVEPGLLPDRGGSRGGAMRPRSAVYVGAIAAWFDRGLLAAVARRMPGWTFDVYGPGGAPGPEDPPNLQWRGSLSRDLLADTLAQYEVGLIPFQDADGRMRYVERPMKFYEYIAAGLGVASTDLGALRQGMGDLACYGNGVDGFVQAIEQARFQASVRPAGFQKTFIAENSWDARARDMQERLSALLAR